MDCQDWSVVRLLGILENEILVEVFDWDTTGWMTPTNGGAESQVWDPRAVEDFVVFDPNSVASSGTTVWRIDKDYYRWRISDVFERPPMTRNTTMDVLGGNDGWVWNMEGDIWENVYNFVPLRLREPMKAVNFD